MDHGQTNVDPICVRSRLLDAAERVVSRDGVKNFTLDAVAQEAGVSKGGLLYHFPSKSALITEIVERLANRCETDQNKALEQVPPAPGAFTRAYLTARANPPEPEKRPVHSAILAGAGTDPQLLDPFRQRFVEWQARLLSDGIEPETAMIVRLAVDGISLCRLLGMPVPQGELHDRVMQRLIAMTQAAVSEQNQEN